jgi:hypothetical protein
MNMSPVMVKLFFCDALTAMGQDGNTNKTFFCRSCHHSQRGCETLQVSTGFGRPLFRQRSLRTVCRMVGYGVSPSSFSLHVIQVAGSTLRDVYASEPIIMPDSLPKPRCICEKDSSHEARTWITYVPSLS